MDDGEIRSLEPIRALRRLEAIDFFGNTVVQDGNLDVLRELPRLGDVRFQDRRHYSVARNVFPPWKD